MSRGYPALTEKEKETLRLILQGHDAKSMANALDLSVHTINERLRAARRKFEVTSSKEAARLLLEVEGATPEFLGAKDLGDAQDGAAAAGPATGKARLTRASIVGGLFFMSLILATALLFQTVSPFTVAGAQADTTSQQAQQTEAVARSFLEMIDRGDWAGSYAATTAKFHDQNSLQVWTDVSKRVRLPLGTLVSRELRVNEQTPMPEGYVLVKFRSEFSNRDGGTETATAITETVTLVRENGAWKVSGVFAE